MTLTFAISVPIGAYHPFLRDCLESLALQCDQQVKFDLNIAILDASGDPRVGALIDEFDTAFAYRRHGPDDGQSSAIIEGWQKVSGDVLGWLNADDMLFPGALAHIANVFENDPGYDVVYGHSTILDLSRQMMGYHWAVEPPGPRILSSGTISQPSCLFRRSAYDHVGGLNRSLHYTMDWDLWIRLYKSGAKFGYTRAPLSLVLWGENTKTSSFNRERRNELRSLIESNLDAQEARRVFRSFAIHNFLEKLQPPLLRRLVIRNLVRGRNQIFNISGDGKMANDATLHLTHFDANPKDIIRAQIENVEVISNVSSSSAVIKKWSVTNGVLELELEAPASKGDIVDLIFAVKSGRSPYFRSASWA